jgi:YebC/PmpR family DNA-binding regulatory protein
MAGHSKFANIKHKKGKEDAKRGKIFTKIGKEITIAAKLGGEDLNFNARLRHAIDKAKAANMPKANIDKAIKKGSGKGEAEDLFEIRYEGYGPKGVAVVIEALTDNKNRTASEVRHAFNKFNGSLGETGSLSWIFDRKGLIILEKDIEEDNILDLVLSSEAEDYIKEGDNICILTSPENLYKVVEKISEKVEINQSQISMMPKSFVNIKEEDVEELDKFIDFVNDLEDVQEVYTNFKLEE